MNLVFGEEDKLHFHVGSPLEMEDARVNLDLARLVERSSGVFGKSGTGKSFITRILLAGLIRSQIASCLIFDMHNDYGWAVRDEAGREFKGLRQLFDSRVSVITLDPETSRHRGSKVDGELRIGLERYRAGGRRADRPAPAAQRSPGGRALHAAPQAGEELDRAPIERRRPTRT